MMYQNQFVVSARNDRGEILRENRNHEIFLPYNSRYSLLLKNKNYRNALAQVQIDGTDVLGGERLVIHANRDVSLERFCIDGNLSCGREFVFVPANDPRVQDSSSPQNGIIHVRFWLEKEHYRPPVTPIQPRKPWRPKRPYPGPFPNPWEPVRPWDEWNEPQKFRMDTRGFGSGTSCNVSSMDFCDEGGATVEGNVSSQRFHHEEIGDVESFFTDIRLYLKPYQQSVTVTDSRFIFCDRCRQKNRYNANFCNKCGNNLRQGVIR